MNIDFEKMKANTLRQDPLLSSEQFAYHQKEHPRANDCGYWDCKAERGETKEQ